MIQEKFLNKVSEAKASGKSVGLVQGSWDLFHLGHLRYILKARELCDFLIIAMDSDQKIKIRKGNSRPIIPEDERYEFIKLLNIADEVIIKDVEEIKWGLIKAVRPDVLIAIRDNYSDDEIDKLKQICGRVAILPRQSESSTSDKIRKIIISSKGEQFKDIDEKLEKTILKMKKRIGYSDDMKEPIPMLFKHLKESTDWVCPVAAGCFWNGCWHFGTNHADFNIPKYDIEKRTELYYSFTEHAEMNLLKKLGEVQLLNTPIYTTLFPCDDCMKVLIDKGVREIYYIEDHPDRNWSKRSHARAHANGVKLIQITGKEQKIENINYCEEKNDNNLSDYKYIYPPNARHQEQLDIMMDFEKQGKDPMDPAYINQEILYMTDYWFISHNKFPYKGSEQHFLIVARKPILKKEEITPEMWLDLQKIWMDLAVQYNIPGGAICFRFGEPSLSGASLKRFHVHLIMPKNEEVVKFSVGGHKELKKGLYLKKDQESNGTI